jgi:hypothetical protein
MKVHPGMLMKTKKGKFEGRDVGCQEDAATVSGLIAGCRTLVNTQKYAKMKVHPGMSMKIKDGRFYLSGAWSRGCAPWISG